MCVSTNQEKREKFFTKAQRAYYARLSLSLKDFIMRRSQNSFKNDEVYPIYHILTHSAEFSFEISLFSKGGKNFDAMSADFLSPPPIYIGMFLIHLYFTGHVYPSPL